MNTVDKLNAIVGYIEQNICEEIDMEHLARNAMMSAYDLQRLFSFVCEISLSEYIRKRRLTLAAVELENGSAKVIDIAMKYGYTSPVSFARAFKSFHGFNPGDIGKPGTVLKNFPRIEFKIEVKKVMNALRNDVLTVNGKPYNAEYYGEADMSRWSSLYAKRQYWRVENAYEDFCKGSRTCELLPCSNFPPIAIVTGQAFAIDYHRLDGNVERKYYITDGTVWNGMESAVEVALDFKPLRLDPIEINGKTYTAEYYGEQDMADFSELHDRREYWRIKDAYADFEGLKKTQKVLPYCNLPRLDIEVGQVFMIDYHCKGSEAVERVYYIADGTVWQNMKSLREVEF